MAKLLQWRAIQIFRQSVLPYLYKYQDILFLIPLVCLALDKIVGHYDWLIYENNLPWGDDSQWYLDYARNLMESFAIELHMNDLLYLGYNVLLTLLLAVFKEPAKIVWIQAICAGFSVILVYEIARMLFGRLTALFSAYFYYNDYNITLWAMYILTDSFFIDLLLLVVYLMLKFFATGKRLYKYLFVASMLYMLIFRPTGVLILGSIVCYMLFRLHKETFIRFFRKYGKWMAIGGSSTFVAIIVLLVTGKLDPLIGSMQYSAKLVLYNQYARGWVYDKPTPHDYFFRPDYTIDIMNSLIVSFIVHNWDPIMIMYFRRMIAFLGRWVWTPDFSTLRGIKDYTYNMLPVIMFIWGTIAAIWKRTFRKGSIAWFITLAIFMFNIVIFVDYMYRYRAPAIPFIAIVAGYGAAVLVQLLSQPGLHVVKKLTGMLVPSWQKKNL